ncbi:hypothetical protein MJG53_009661 [Ovis ammon polii x Ovis aries]|uniref:Uncharacterized protein n=1 Tax=Ovis ammon polii x Ovis aries TaxID=2918886 RepID=A0ACB9UWZ7_9CETA|nr:hypothetical protein MJG53_009661 [Ovis ammon polii x Ovis aries]
MSENSIYSFCSEAQSYISCSLRPRGLSGFSNWGILPAGMVEWGAIFSSRGSSPPQDGTGVSFASFFGRRILYHVGSPSMVLRVNSFEPVRCPDKLFLYQGNWKRSQICRG